MRGPAFTVLLILSCLSCSALAKEQSYRPPRLDTGQPDMQGMWIVSNFTPLQRPPGFTTLAIDEAQLDRGRSAEWLDSGQRSLPAADRPRVGRNALGNGRTGAASCSRTLPRIGDGATAHSRHTQRRHHRAVRPRCRGPDRLLIHGRGSDLLHAALAGRIAFPASRRADARIRVSRSELLDGAHPGGCTGARSPGGALGYAP
jgi:hypothetical protein